MKLTYSKPTQMHKEAQHQMLKVPPVKLFTDPAHQKLREKWCAAMFGMGYEKFVEPCEVALNDTPLQLDADFFLKVREQEYPFQLAEVQEDGRRRGDEYKGFANGSLRSVPYDPERGRLEGPDWIAAAIQRKAGKNYSNSQNLHLTIYANFSASGLQYQEVVRRATPYTKAFASIWLITSLHIATLIPGQTLGSIDGLGEISTLDEYVSLSELRARKD
jgi:hypothetical protein